MSAFIDEWDENDNPALDKNRTDFVDEPDLMSSTNPVPEVAVGVSLEDAIMAPSAVENGSKNLLDPAPEVETEELPTPDSRVEEPDILPRAVPTPTSPLTTTESIAIMASQLQSIKEDESLALVTGGGYLKRAATVEAAHKTDPSSRWRLVANANSIPSQFSESNVEPVSTTDKMMKTSHQLFGSTNKTKPKKNWKKVQTKVEMVGKLKRTETNPENEAQSADKPDIESAAEVKEETPPEDTGIFLNMLTGETADTYLQQRSNFDKMKQFYQYEKDAGNVYRMKIVSCFMVPSLIVSAILFYLLDNPILGDEDKPGNASISYWAQFIFCRQVITFSLAKAFEVIWIDFVCLRTRIGVRYFGPFFTLMMVQARGWPYILACWCVLNFCLLYGDAPFSKHWLFWQDAIDMFNSANPSGDLVYRDDYFRLLIAGIVTGVCVTIKRVWMSTYFGKHQLDKYGLKLHKLILKMLLVAEVAALGKQILDQQQGLRKDKKYRATGALYNWQFSSLKKKEVDDDDSDIEEKPPDSEEELPKEDGEDNEKKTKWSQYLKDHLHPEDKKSANQLLLSPDGKKTVMQMLDEWEEPIIMVKKDKTVSIRNVLDFRQAITNLDEPCLFSSYYGLTRTRLECIECAEAVYKRLLSHTPYEKSLPFETLSLGAIDDRGILEEEKVKALIRLFRPDRNGDLSLLDFVQSCDNVYKQARMLQATMINSNQIDAAYESLLNFVFYFFLGLIVLAIMEIYPLTAFLSLTGVILGFAFIFGPASSKYFEGLMLVFLREPYDIGDRIALSDVEEDTKSSGSSTWFVEGVTLFTTTVRYATTNEVASLANGSLANSRIINAARSPKANVQVYMKFSVNVPYQRVLVFRKDVEAFVKALPREWISLNAIRATRVETELGYIEYMIALTHRKSFQELGDVLQSKADVTGYCLEVSKKLGITFEAPPMPVTLGLDQITAELLFLRREFDSIRPKTGDEKDDSSEEKETEILPTESEDQPDLQTFIDSFASKKPITKK